jgi:hypothetical protein
VGKEGLMLDAPTICPSHGEPMSIRPAWGKHWAFMCPECANAFDARWWAPLPEELRAILALAILFDLDLVASTIETAAVNLQGATAMQVTKRTRTRPKKVAAHARLWSVVVFHTPGRGLVGLYPTKVEADQVAKQERGRFILPPKNAWRGRDDQAQD